MSLPPLKDQPHKDDLFVARLFNRVVRKDLLPSPHLRVFFGDTMQKIGLWDRASQGPGERRRAGAVIARAAHLSESLGISHEWHRRIINKDRTVASGADKLVINYRMSPEAVLEVLRQDDRDLTLASLDKLRPLVMAAPEVKRAPTVEPPPAKTPELVEEESIAADVTPPSEEEDRCARDDLADIAEREGWSTEAFARARVRSAKLSRIVRKKRMAAGNFQCDYCGFDPEVEGWRAGVGLDIHHKVPLEAGERLSRASDMMVLCARCHRLEHAAMKPGAVVPVAFAEKREAAEAASR